jgi:hypothetical protein
VNPRQHANGWRTAFSFKPTMKKLSFVVFWGFVLLFVFINLAAAYHLWSQTVNP